MFDVDVSIVSVNNSVRFFADVILTMIVLTIICW